MKTKFYFGALAALAFGLTGCANEDPAPDQGDNTGGERYMAVTIRTLGDTRALPSDKDFEQGIGNENQITNENIRFYFFTASGAPFLMQQTNVNGIVSNTNMVKPVELTPNLTNGEQTSIDGVLVLGTPSGDGYQGETPAKVIAIANPKKATFESFSNISISDLQNKYSVLDTPLDFSTFSMSSSTYMDNEGKEVCWTDVTGCIKSTEDDARSNPAQIYLERLAAKVRVTGLGNYTVKKKNEDGSLIDGDFLIRKQDGSAVKSKLKVTLEGWSLINLATATYALKDISSCLTNAPFPDWNDVSRHRCYWASTYANETIHMINTTYDLDSSDAFPYGNFDSQKPTENIAYTYGNTRFIPPMGASDRSTLATGIVVKATITDDSNNPVNLIRWGAEYFTLDYFKEVVANAWTTTDGTGSAAATDVELIPDDKVKNTYKVTVKDQEFTGRFTGIYWWKNGVTTYRANIIHYQGADKTLFGVVRNHIYDYKFTNVVGLGLPGEDPVNPPDVKESYLAAVVNVLNWHIVSNETVLE